MAAMAIRGLASLSLSCAPPAPLRIEAREPTWKETVKVRHRRIRKKLNGTEERPPLAVLRSNKHLSAQVIDDTKQHTLASSSTLKKALREGIEMSSGPTVSARRLITRTAASRQQYNVPQQPETLPLWLWICISSYQTLKDALLFLWEQPGQLQFIEWPSLQSTVRMAMLTVVVVAFLIIFLATIDSTFSFVLSSILRRVP